MRESKFDHKGPDDTLHEFGAHGYAMKQFYFDLGAGRREEAYGERAEMVFDAVLEMLSRGSTLSPDELIALMDRITSLHENLFDVQEKLDAATARETIRDCERVRDWLEAQKALIWDRLCALRPDEAQAMKMAFQCANDEYPSFALAARTHETITQTNDELRSRYNHCVTEGKRLGRLIRKRSIIPKTKIELQQKIVKNKAIADKYRHILHARERESTSRHSAPLET